MGRRWTNTEKKFLHENAPHMTYREIGEKLDRSGPAVNQMASKLGIKKEPNVGQFQKGQKPFNKGMAQEDFMSPEAIERTKATRFKKGEKPANTKFDGAITWRKASGDRNGYLWIRCHENNWQTLHSYLWEQDHGPVPEGHIIVFKNGNTMDVRPDNLKCISRAENAQRNKDWKKAMQTMNERGNHPSRDLTPGYVAAMMAGGDQEIKNYLLTRRPDLIRLARAHYQLKRKIKQDEQTDE